MRTCSWNRQSNSRRWRRALSSFALFALGTIATAQTLARPGWAGSGVAIEPWWRRAVFYRIDPDKFQDSDGDGKGDLAGIAQRLGYLQSLGVDAIVLRLPSAEASPDIQSGFDSLARTASEHKVRVMVELAAPGDAAASEETYLNAARFWLDQGAAGIVLDSATYTGDSDDHAAAFVHSLHTLLSGFPGGRILIADAAPIGDPALLKALAQSAQLVMRKPLAAATTAAALRAEMEAALSAEPEGIEPATTAPARTSTRRRTRTREAGAASFSNFLWVAGRVQPLPKSSAAQQLVLQRTMAMVLLGSRAAVLIDYGEEIGLGSDAVMQWTPKNITPPPPPAPIERREAIATTANGHTIPPKPKPRSDVYGPYVPYVPPAKPKPAEADTPAKLDPDTLPGFTTGGLIEPPPPDAATRNVAVEEADSHSLLSLYRKLIQLHHGNASLRNGAETLLNRDELNALVWVRNAPPGATTAGTVVAICNISGKPLDLSLQDEFKLRAGTFRTIAGDAKVIGGRISLAPGGVWLGEWQR
jgi:hypothetical protein